MINTNCLLPPPQGAQGDRHVSPYIVALDRFSLIGAGAWLVFQGR
jgi:hypothetical protein